MSPAFTEAEAREVSDERGFATFLFGSEDNPWKVRVPMTRVARRSWRNRRDPVTSRMAFRRRRVAEGTAAQLLAHWQKQAQLREIQAALDELVAEGRATYDAETGSYQRISPPLPVSEWRAEEIARRWRRGESLKEIAEAMDSTANSISVSVVRMRQAGWDLPYRYPGTERRPGTHGRKMTAASHRASAVRGF